MNEFIDTEFNKYFSDKIQEVIVDQLPNGFPKHWEKDTKRMKLEKAEEKHKKARTPFIFYVYYIKDYLRETYPELSQGQKMAMASQMWRELDGFQKNKFIKMHEEEQRELETESESESE